ncbi:MAG: lipopolysaccharide biosynthesis protein, partial [Bacteroidales bacterium]|nr:lipopolysaccharide biosynthesis protein [Bacteroidales bacterium]
MKDTAIYGLSSIVGRFLNYLLVPLYTYKIAAESGGYGIVTNLYAYTAFFLALLTFGMETTLFRFSNKDGEDPRKVYGTVLRMVGLVALVFIAVILSLVRPISGVLGYAAHPEYVGCMAIIVAMDAFQAIMFSRLRQQRRPIKFMALKFAFIIPNVLLNLFVFLVMPKMFGRFPALEELYVRFDYGVGLIFFVNFVCTFLVNIGFISELKGLGYGFDKGLAKRMLAYTWPLLILSLVGILNQVADKMLFPKLMPGQEGMVQLGIYGACVKIAMIMSLLTQAFRYAYEPIVFNGSRDKNSPETLADGMKYFLIFTLLAFLAVMFYMPLLRRLVRST